MAFFWFVLLHKFFCFCISRSNNLAPKSKSLRNTTKTNITNDGVQSYSNMIWYFEGGLGRCVVQTKRCNGDRLYRGGYGACCRLANATISFLRR